MSGPVADPAAVDAAGRELVALAGGLAAVASRLAALRAAGWQGVAARAAATVLATQPDRLDRAAEAFGAAGRALGEHAAVLAQSRAILDCPGGPPSQAVELAAALTARSGADTARALDAAADAAPARGSWLSRALDTLDDWRAEVGLGAGETVEQLAGLVLRLAPARALSDPTGAATDHAGLLTGVGRAVRDPAGFGRALIDYDTWAENPARAVGHLLPDALAALAGAGLATRSASQLATARRAGVGARAEQARRLLLVRAAQDARAVTATAWAADGVRLSPGDSALAEAYLRANGVAEPRITPRLQEVSGRLRVQLEQLDKRLKEADSLKRKLGTQLLGEGTGRVQAQQLLHTRHADTLRYTMVFPDADYARQAGAASAELERHGLALHRVRNSWDAVDGYRGLNTTWADPGSGVRFELQFHSPRSWRATVDTHPLYELKREPSTPAAVRRELQAVIAAHYRLALPPPGSLVLQPRTMLPAARAATVPAAALAATGAQLAGGLSRPSSAGGPAARRPA